jgi:hypothetical protein
MASRRFGRLWQQLQWRCTFLPGKAMYPACLLPVAEGQLSKYFQMRTSKVKKVATCIPWARRFQCWDKATTDGKYRFLLDPSSPSSDVYPWLHGNGNKPQGHNLKSVHGISHSLMSFYPKYSWPSPVHLATIKICRPSRKLYCPINEIGRSKFDGSFHAFQQKEWSFSH